MKLLQFKLSNTQFPLEKGVRGLFSILLIFQNYKIICPNRTILFINIESKTNVLDSIATRIQNAFNLTFLSCFSGYLLIKKAGI